MIALAAEKLTILLQGKIPDKFNCAQIDQTIDRDFAEAFNQLIAFIEEIHQSIGPLARGQLSDVKCSSNNYIASPLKELDSRLRHLIWQAKQVAGGDYGQRVDFMGEFSEAFNFMIIALERNERMLKEKIDELEQALGHIKKLEGFLRICSNCNRIKLENCEHRDSQIWISIERYINARTNTQFSHTICPDCMQKLYPEYVSPK